MKSCFWWDIKFWFKSLVILDKASVWEIVAFALKHRDSTLIVDNLVSNGSFLFGEHLAGYSFHGLGDREIFQGSWYEIVQIRADNLQASGVNDQFKMIILKEEIALRCL